MAYDFIRTNRTIDVIYNDFTEGKLIVDKSYQRRKVWNDEDKVRLIETILLGLVMPEVYFWVSNVDEDTGKTITHIVDGQQRITTIAEFVLGEFALTEKKLLDDGIKKEYGGLMFKQLDGEAKKKIWQYPISVVEIDRSCSKEIIKKMFNRLNLTNYCLNPQEKRNSLDSAFGEKCEALATLDFWDKNKVFSSSDAKRMKDIEYCCSIYILAKDGIVDQTNGKIINNYYDDYRDDFDNDKQLENKIYKSMEIICNLSDKTTIQFISKKAQMYTLFCLAFNMIEENVEMSKVIFEKFKLFVCTYNKFRNEFSLSYDDPLLSNTFENIKKYKLASSEGINKIKNRMIRFEIIKTICISSDGSVIKALEKISSDLDNSLKSRTLIFDKFEEDDIIDINE